MTTPSPDVPTATVPLGASEIASYITAGASLLVSIVGKDWGIGGNAQALGLLASALIVMVSSISRAIKHHSAVHANAAVYAAQMGVLASTVNLVTDPKSVAQMLTAATSVVNQVTTAVNVDVPPPTAAVGGI
jgi:FtsH-binding integral membrane protein